MYVPTTTIELRTATWIQCPQWFALPGGIGTLPIAVLLLYLSDIVLGEPSSRRKPPPSMELVLWSELFTAVLWSNRAVAIAVDPAG
jgi:hypothetical protein